MNNAIFIILLGLAIIGVIGGIAGFILTDKSGKRDTTLMT